MSNLRHDKKFKGKKNEDIASFFNRIDHNLRPIAKNLHAIILKADPTLEYGMKWGAAAYWKRSNIFWIYSMNPTYVNFGFFKGAKLTKHDPKHLIEGTGKGIRHIKLRTLRNIDQPYFMRLIKKALELDRG